MICSRFCLQLHLNLVHAVVQLRPSMQHLKPEPIVSVDIKNEKDIKQLKKKVNFLLDFKKPLAISILLCNLSEFKIAFFDVNYQSKLPGVVNDQNEDNTKEVLDVSFTIIFMFSSYWCIIFFSNGFPSTTIVKIVNYHVDTLKKWLHNKQLKYNFR